MKSAAASLLDIRNMTANLHIDISIIGGNSARARNSWIAASPIHSLHEDRFQRNIIAFGNGTFGNMRWKRPDSVKKIRCLYYLSRTANVNISVVKVDEYLTSQLCALCDQCNFTKSK
jgi:hypothetical protein